MCKCYICTIFKQQKGYIRTLLQKIFSSSFIIISHLEETNFFNIVPPHEIQIFPKHCKYQTGAKIMKIFIFSNESITFN